MLPRELQTQGIVVDSRELCSSDESARAQMSTSNHHITACQDIQIFTPTIDCPTIFARVSAPSVSISTNAIFKRSDLEKSSMSAQQMLRRKRKDRDRAGVAKRNSILEGSRAEWRDVMRKLNPMKMIDTDHHINQDYLFILCDNLSHTTIGH